MQLDGSMKRECCLDGIEKKQNHNIIVPASLEIEPNIIKYSRQTGMTLGQIGQVGQIDQIDQIGNPTALLSFYGTSTT